VKASFTAAIMVRSLLAALGEVWLVGVLVGWVVVRLVVCWPGSWEVVVVAVDMKWFLFFVCEGGWERD
jgi:predicted membrane metal-binding protein